jgi:hypothetical protein
MMATIIGLAVLLTACAFVVYHFEESEGKDE